MLISWVQKTTLLDYPWKIWTIIFTLWCNLRCHYCHNYEFVLPESVQNFMNDLIPEQAFFNFLKTRIGFIDGVIISGWEPTLQKDLYEFIVKVKEMWFLVKLDTNGRDPVLLERLISKKLVDYVAMDIKNPFTTYSKITWIEDDVTNYIKSSRILIDWTLNYELRTTVVKWYHDEEIIAQIWEDIKWAKKWFLQNFEDKNILKTWFDGKTFTVAELEKLKEVGEKYVEKCEIRK